MSGVWVFKSGVVRCVGNPSMSGESGRRRKALVHVGTNEVIASYRMLEDKLKELGWERYWLSPPEMIQFHKPSSVHLISLPSDFAHIKLVNLYDIVVKSRNLFEVRDA